MSFPVFVFNFAAFSHAGYSWHLPQAVFNANVIGTLNLLQSQVDHRIELACFDQVGTSEEYGNAHGLRHSDDLGEVVFNEASPLDIDLGEQAGHWGARTLLSDPDRFRPGDSEVLALRVDASKIRDAVGWEPTVTWEAGLNRTIAYATETLLTR